MAFNIPNNPLAKDAESAGKYCISYIFPKRRWEFHVSVDVIYTLARMAGHWAGLSLSNKYSKMIYDLNRK